MVTSVGILNYSDGGFTWIRLIDAILLEMFLVLWKDMGGYCRSVYISSIGNVAIY